MTRTYDETRMRDGRGRWRAEMSGVLLTLLLGWNIPVVAQVTYSVFPAHAVDNASETQPVPHSGRVTLVVKDSTIDYVTREVLRQANLRPVFINNASLSTKRVSVHLVDVTAMDALAVILRGTGLSAKLASDGETVVIRARSGLIPDEQTQLAGGTLVGRVTDSASGQGLGGASIHILGLKTPSAVTSDSGNFTLRDVPAGDQLLTVRLFGYKPVQRSVTVVDSQRTMVRIIMVPVPTVLSGIVTTATGTQRKVQVGNDITTLNVDSVMRVAPVTSVTDLLETRVPGLTVLHSDGVPGDPARIRIRGPSSVSGNNDPIVIVDGIRVYASQSDPRTNNLTGQFVGTNLGVRTPAPSPLDQLDPNSIETIEVLKGPSASALYGSDAANGVIVVTTKHGQAGPTRWTLDLGAGRNTLPGSWPTHYFAFGNDTVGTSNSYPLCQWNDPSCRVDSVVAYQALNDPRYSPFSVGHDQTAALTISGGVPTVTYSLTGSATGTRGNLKLPGIEVQRYEKFYGPIPSYLRRPDTYQTWGLNGTVTQQPYTALRVMLTSSLFTGDQQQGSLNTALPQLAVSYIDPTQLSSTPLIQNDVERQTDHQVTTTHVLMVAWQPRPWLPVTATGGINTTQKLDQAEIPFGVNNAGPGSAVTDTNGLYSVGRGTSEMKTLSLGTNIPTPRQIVTVGVGGQFTSQSTSDMTFQVNALSPGVKVPTACPNDGFQTSLCSVNQATSAGSTYGWYVEPRFNLASRFFVAPGFRLDGGSASGAHGGFSGTGLTGFPKIDFSYLAVDQNHSRGGVTLLRPRIAFGVAGTQPGSTEKLRLFNAGVQTTTTGTVTGITGTGGQGGASEILNGQAVPVVDLTALGNTQLRPETSRELEGGVDLELWHGRVALTWTAYNKTRINAIVPIPVAPSVSASPIDMIWQNIGDIRNTGTELTLTTRLLESRALEWVVSGNFSVDHNLVLRLNNQQSSFFLGNNQYIRVGYPMSSDFERPIVGFADMNHDGILEPNEVALGDSLVYAGQGEPLGQFNLNTGVTLLNGRLSVNAGFAYQYGLTQVNGGDLQALALYPNAPNASLATQAAIVAAGDAGSIYSSFNAFNSSGYTGSRLGLVQTVNTLRFNTLSVNYTMPSAVAAWFRVPRVSVALQGSNLGLWTNYRGKDPNVNAFSTVSGGDETADLGQIPEPRTWWLKLKLGN